MRAVCLWPSARSTSRSCGPIGLTPAGGRWLGLDVQPTRRCSLTGTGASTSQYLSNPFGEHLAPGQTFVSTSSGRQASGRWPVPVFHIYFLRPGPNLGSRIGDGDDAPAHGVLSWRRMGGWYLRPLRALRPIPRAADRHRPRRAGGSSAMALTGRSTSSATTPSPTGPSRTRPRFPFYARSTDQPASWPPAKSLLADKLVTIQWREEDRSEDGFYTVAGPVLQAPSIFHRKDGTAVALWKHSWAALSTDEGQSWSTPVQAAERGDGRRQDLGATHDRWPIRHRLQPGRAGPLAAGRRTEQGSGIEFGPLMLLNGDVPPRRFFGRAKDFGLQYVRGIAEGNGRPPGQDLWVTYSSNKEDIWVSRVPATPCARPSISRSRTASTAFSRAASFRTGTSTAHAGRTSASPTFPRSRTGACAWRTGTPTTMRAPSGCSLR